MVRDDTGAPIVGATCTWMAVDEAVGCTRAFRAMWWSSRRLVCRGLPEPGLRVNEISWIHWSQRLLTTLLEWPNGQVTHLADHPASVMPMILPSHTATAAHIVFENGVMAYLAQFFLCK
ncbi:uncharacterized protein TNCV_31561 [Trichonephila clavipes]|nr:uncharacterized protein TNCV_31561 [Trichonephila clavipes]